MATTADLLKEISAGKFRPVYYFYGSEDYRIIEAEKFIARQYLPDRQLQTNFHRIDGKKTPLSALITKLSSLPMLGERQIFAISQFQNYSPKEVERILQVLDPPPPDRVVILSSPASKAPKRSSKFFTKVSKIALPVEFKKLTLPETVKIIRTTLKKEKLHIEEEALSFLGELVAGNRGALEAEMQKLINFKQPGETITLDDVKQVTAGHEVFSVFEIADLVVSRRSSRLLKAMRSLLAHGTSPAAIATLLQQHFISLYLVKNNKPPLGKRGFLTQKFSAQARKYDNRRLEEIIIRIADAEAEIRQQRFTQEMALEILALSLTGEYRG